MVKIVGELVFGEHAELLSCVYETKGKTGSEDTERVNRKLQHPLTLRMYLARSNFHPFRQVSNLPPPIRGGEREGGRVLDHIINLSVVVELSRHSFSLL